MFNPLTALLVSDLVAEGALPPGPRAVDLGNQTYGVDRGTLEAILLKLEVSAAAARCGLDAAALRAWLNVEPGGPGAPLVGEFYRALGFSAYDAIDINSRFGSLVMDLNKDLAAEYGFTRTYDLVVNTGTSEHVFDQAAFLRNAHNLAAPGGLMLHVIPFLGYVNHGFYNYQPNLVFDLAAANGYDLVKLLMADRYRVLLDLRTPNDLSAHFRNYLALVTPSETNNTFLAALMRRSGGREFVHPCQGKYLADVEGHGLTAYYGPQTSARGDSSSGAMFPPANPRRRRKPAHRLKKHVKRAILRSLRRASRFVLVHVWPEL